MPFSLFTFPRRTTRFASAMLLTAGLLAAAPASADDAKGLTDAQKQAIEKMIHQYIMDNPEVLLESVKQHQEAREQARQEHAKKAVAVLAKELNADPASPVAGNPKGDVTVVEFFDYRCGYCKRVQPVIQKLLEDDKNVKLVFKEFPILGPDSMIAARAALAVWNTDRSKYVAFHDALMAGRTVNESTVIKLAEKAGIDAAALKKAMADAEIDAALARNFQLAEALNINGTPAFVVGDQLVPGAIDLGKLKELIATARGS